MKCFGSIKKAVMLAVVIALTATGTAFAVTKKVDGGVWDYGTNVILGVAWSSFWHPSKKHASSVMIGANVYRSDCVGGGKTAYAERWRPPGARASYHYRFC